MDGWTDTPDFSKSIRSSHSDDLKVSDEVLVWLSVWSEVQWFAYGQADSTATSSRLASLKLRLF